MLLLDHVTHIKNAARNYENIYSFLDKYHDNILKIKTVLDSSDYTLGTKKSQGILIGSIVLISLGMVAANAYVGIGLVGLLAFALLILVCVELRALYVLKQRNNESSKVRTILNENNFFKIPVNIELHSPESVDEFKPQ